MKINLTYITVFFLIIGIYGCGTADDSVDDPLESETITIQTPEPETELGEGLVLGSYAPDFELTDGYENLHTLSEHLDAGKNVVIVFYRTGG